MNNLKFLAGLLIVIFGFSGCNKDDVDPVLESGVVINELMSSNANVVADQNGEYDDWIELYNNTVNDVNLSGYYLTDSKSNQIKWSIPEGTIISQKSYLIIWADGDTLQIGLHTNYKLSALGETVVLLTPELKVIDMVEYGEQPIVVGEPAVEKSFGRVPNGTGAFSWQVPSYNSEN